MRRLLILALVLIAAACSRSDTEKPRIGLVPATNDDPAAMLVIGTLESEAGGKAELAVAEARDAQSAQNEAASSLLDKKPRAIAVEPVDASGIDPFIKQAKAKRVPIVFFGLEPPRKSMRSWDKLFFVGTRREDFGSAQGELLASYWKANPAADHDRDGTLRFVALISSGDEEGSTRQADAAAKAIVAAGVPSVMLAREATAEGALAARKKAAALIAVYGERIEAFVCPDDDAALGAAEALKAAGYAKGRRHVPVVGASLAAGPDELPEQVVAGIKAEALAGTVCLDPVAQGKAVFELSYALARDLAPSKAGLRIADAKYLWVPCRKVAKGDLQPKN